MLDPDGDGDNKDYYEIQINPQNLVFDTQYDDYNSPNGNGRGPFGHEEWSANLTSAVVVHGTLDDDSDVDQGYTVEAKIPWASFTKAQHAPPRPGDTWRMNFYAMKNNGGTAWSPILGMGNFHRASSFGRVRWSATTAPWTSFSGEVAGGPLLTLGGDPAGGEELAEGEREVFAGGGERPGDLLDVLPGVGLDVGGWSASVICWRS